jgi:predicted flap endonuclease-1-like 5' DNA nuclease
MPPVVEEVVAEEPPPDQAPALEHHAMQFVEGIGPAYAEKLGAAGVNSTESLLERGSTPTGRSLLAEETGISHKLILTWVNHADLMRIKGVGSQFADLLEEAGVDTVPDLARRNAANLYEKIVAVNDEKNLVRHLPSGAEVEKWVEEAKTLPRIVQY